MKLSLLFLSLVCCLAPTHALQIQQEAEAKTDSNSSNSDQKTVLHIYSNLNGNKIAQHLTMNISDPELLQENDITKNEKIHEIVASLLLRKVEDLKFIELPETNRSLRKPKPTYKTITLFVQERHQAPSEKVEVKLIINLQNP